MAVEIERKFLVDIERLPTLPAGTVIKQGYLPSANKTVTRVRLKGEQAFLTVKGANNAAGTTRLEFEYEIPVADAEQMLASLCDKPLVEKIRYEIAVAEHIIELDVFSGDNEGLVVAEVELASEGEAFEKPDWMLQEVTGDARYYNSSLIKSPYTLWL